MRLNAIIPQIPYPSTPVRFDPKQKDKEITVNFGPFPLKVKNKLWGNPAYMKKSNAWAAVHLTFMNGKEGWMKVKKKGLSQILGVNEAKLPSQNPKKIEELLDRKMFLKDSRAQLETMNLFMKKNERKEERNAINSLINEMEDYPIEDDQRFTELELKIFDLLYHIKLILMKEIEKIRNQLQNVTTFDQALSSLHDMINVARCLPLEDRQRLLSDQLPYFLLQCQRFLSLEKETYEENTPLLTDLMKEIYHTEVSFQKALKAFIVEQDFIGDGNQRTYADTLIDLQVLTKKEKDNIFLQQSWIDLSNTTTLFLDMLEPLNNSESSINEKLLALRGALTDDTIVDHLCCLATITMQYPLIETLFRDIEKYDSVSASLKVFKELHESHPPSDLLAAPFQRLARYPLLLGELIKGLNGQQCREDFIRFKQILDCVVKLATGSSHEAA